MAALIATLPLTACSDNDASSEMHRPAPLELPDVGDIHNGVKAPLYWSIYEYVWDQDNRYGVPGNQMDFTLKQWDQVLDWLVSSGLRDAGFDMVCTDGWITLSARDGSPYTTHHGSVSIADIVAHAHRRGIKVGIYDNPLWIHCPDHVKVPGTDVTVGSLREGRNDKVAHPDVNDTFTYVMPDHQGAREYIQGFFKHYHDLGVDYIRMDYLSWFEDGNDRGVQGHPGRGHGRDNYARALAYSAQAAKQYGIFLSLVMPHCYNDAELEAKYGNMFRVDSDCHMGRWNHISADSKGHTWAGWPAAYNQFDGFLYWSHLAGRDKVRLDGDFLRLHNLANDHERQFAVSLQLMSGGPLTIADQPSTIGDCLKFYLNKEMLALNRDGFVAKPLSDNPDDPRSQIWYGQMTDGSWIVALFNRADTEDTLTAPLASMGIPPGSRVRDLWLHADLKELSGSELRATLQPHACRVVRITR